MKQNVKQELQVHTFDISHRITEWEAKRIKQKYKVKYTDKLCISNTGINGINVIEIKENPIRDSTGTITKTAYILLLQINLGKLLKISNVRMVALSKGNNKKLIKTLENVFKFELVLSPKNSIVGEWTLNRLDCGIDVYIENSMIEVMAEYLKLMNKSLNLCNNRNCKLIEYKGFEENKALYESIYFGNESYTYNIYSKLAELTNKYEELSERQKEEAEGILRIEKQMFGKGVANGVGSPQKLSLLFDESVVQKIITTITKDIKLFFGTGTYVKLHDAYKKIEESKHSTEYKAVLKRMLREFSINGINFIIKNEIEQEYVDEKEVKKQIQKCIKDIEMLGISPVCIVEGQISRLGDIENLKGIYDLLIENSVIKPEKKIKAQFGKIYEDEDHCRYRCNVSYHNADGERIRKSMANKEKSILEDSILNELIKVHKNNLEVTQGNDISRKLIIENTIRDISNFRTTIERKDLLNKIDATLAELQGGN